MNEKKNLTEGQNIEKKKPRMFIIVTNNKTVYTTQKMTEIVLGGGGILLLPFSRQTAHFTRYSRVYLTKSERKNDRE